MPADKPVAGTPAAEGMADEGTRCATCGQDESDILHAHYAYANGKKEYLAGCHPFVPAPAAKPGAERCARCGCPNYDPIHRGIHGHVAAHPFAPSPATREHAAEGEGCWIWYGSLYRNGYGRCRRGGRTVLAHRVVYEATRGPIIEGLTLDHLCGNRACVNPKHLQQVTMAENILRGNGRAARNARKTLCPHGHKYDSMGRGGSGKPCRRCTTCEKQRTARRRAERGAARAR